MKNKTGKDKRKDRSINVKVRKLSKVQNGKKKGEKKEEK